jgi:hypothetical protein
LQEKISIFAIWMHLAAPLLTNLFAKEYAEYENITDSYAGRVGGSHDVPRVVFIDGRDDRNDNDHT